MSNLPAIIASRGISTEVWSALKNSLFPGAADESVLMAWDYCAARGLDVMLKPVHLVPMWIKDKNNGDKGAMRDVVMPGIGLYRIQADRAGNYAGMSAPTFGPDVQITLQGVEITVPEWCELSVSKIVGDRVVTFTAREYWIENYATAGKDTKAPNSMWQKRPRAQLVKCTEAQALRKGWPELGSQPTAEEMEGKEIDVTARSTASVTPLRATELSQTITQEQASQLRLAIEIAGMTEDQFCRDKRINIDSLEQFAAARYEGAINYLRIKAMPAEPGGAA
jgi:phage recombination protein Bet